MEKYENFDKMIAKNVSKFKELVIDKNVRLISHLDSDGICAASIMIRALIRENINYSLSIVPQLKESVLKEIENERYDVILFTDLGSGHIELIKKYLPDKIIFILDHHEIKDQISSDNLFHINPHLVGIDGSKEISGSGVVYRFCERLNEKNKDMSHIAIIGAIGDVQENQGFEHLNQKILDTAIDTKKIKVEKGLKFFGLETKPLYKLLAYNTDPIIPEVSGSESSAIGFMKGIGINPFIGTKERKFFNLTEDEKQRLISSLVLKRSGEENPEDILGKIYYIEGEPDGSPTKDAREFSTLLNACGRLNRSSIGIGTCLNDVNMKRKAVLALNDYKQEIIKTLQWYDKHKDNSEKIMKGKNYIILKPKEEILSTMIGTLSSIISRNKDVEPNTYIMSLAEQEDFSMKVSIRVAGNTNTDEIDVKDIVDRITDQLGGQSGGHKLAAGAIIDPELEDKFIELAIDIFGKKHEENIIVNELA